ncbi:helix-turn-helix domain-containing protein [Nocardioides endophyticus]|uniref:Helix-turn-helix domain-containing protein n=1 Tax=Nocardioides endophyticus TaxID=1353775 RepID=A0ABP8YR49_9ACTN
MEVDTRAVPSRERLEYWHHSVSDRFVPLLATPTSGELHGRIRSVEIAETRARRIAGIEHRFQRRIRDIERSVGTEQLNLVFVNRGETVVEQDARTATIRPGDFLFYDSSRPFEFRTHGAFDYTILLMPKHRLGLSAQVYEACTARPQSCRNPIGASARSLTSSLVGSTTLDIDDHRQLALQEAVLRAVASLIPTADIRPPAEMFVALARAHIRRNLFDPGMSPATVAQAVGISVSYLHRLFSNEQETVAALIREERLQAAMRRLTSPAHASESISDIGRACGLEDPAHFSRVVRARFGVAPRELRLKGFPPTCS